MLHEYIQLLCCADQYAFGNTKEVGNSQLWLLHFCLFCLGPANKNKKKLFVTVECIWVRYVEVRLRLEVLQHTYIYTCRCKCLGMVKGELQYILLTSFILARLVLEKKMTPKSHFISQTIHTLAFTQRVQTMTNIIHLSSCCKSLKQLLNKHQLF